MNAKDRNILKAIDDVELTSPEGATTLAIRLRLVQVGAPQYRVETITTRLAAMASADRPLVTRWCDGTSWFTQLTAAGILAIG